MTTTSRPATPLRQRMIEDMKFRNLSPRTIKAYVERVAAFAQHYGKSAPLLGQKEVRVSCLSRRGEACLVELLRPSNLRDPISLPRDSRQGLGRDGRGLSQKGAEAPSHLKRR
jgi:Phage integrase, N-terminal SAM-like domain